MEAATTAPTLVGVYGTLMCGFENYRRWLAPRTPLATGFMSIPCRMYASAAYPMLVADARPHRVYLEVFEVDAGTLASLDALEEPYDYRRRRFRIDGFAAPVDVYVYEQAEPPPGFEPVSSGRWQPPAGRVEV